MMDFCLTDQEIIQENGQPNAAAARSRRGRPQMANAASIPADDASGRKMRMRVAQRTYHSRKQAALNSAKERSALLESAFSSAVNQFLAFHKYVADYSRQGVPSGIMIELSKTALDIATITKNVQADKISRANNGNRLGFNCISLDNSPHFEEMMPADSGSTGKATELITDLSTPGNDQFLEALLSEKKQVAAERFLQTCMERAAVTLAKRPFGSGCPISELVPLMQVLPFDVLMTLTMNPFAGRHVSFLRDMKHPDTVTRALPKMFRVIEGQTTNPIPRMSPPHLQQLRSGATRTILDTTIPRLMGEWLEAIDVQEYLEERGIIISDDKTVKILQLIPSTQPIDISAPITSAKLYNNTSEDLSAINRTHMADTFNTFGEAVHRQTHIFEDHESSYNLSQESNVFVQVREGFLQTPTAMQESLAQHYNSRSMSSERDQYSFMLPSTSTAIELNVDKLMTELAARAVCLGSMPGLRKEWIDEAIRDSVTISF
ncbi:hypothetical protein V8C35DRAFT_200988 [Trichoderma chlorosporum]